MGRNQVEFLASDLDATGAPGDAAGVFSQVVNITRGVNFTDAGAGVNEDLATLVPCSTVALPGPAAYSTAACQPIGTFEHTSYRLGTGASTPLSAGNATEGISPAGTATNPAKIAPNNTSTTTNTGPAGPAASGASVAGDHFVLSTSNIAK